MKLVYALFCACFIKSSFAFYDVPDDVTEENKWSHMSAAARLINRTAALRAVWDRHLIRHDAGLAEFGYRNFSCPPLKSPTKPTSVHALMPGDIDVVAALGDSLSAASGALAKTPVGILLAYRGVSFTGGGDKTIDEVLTVPNIIKSYNPNVYGFATKYTLPFINSPNKKLDQAVPGARSISIVKQTQKLITQMQSDPKVDMANDWKLITLFIGGNDLCSGSCGRKSGEYTYEHYTLRVRDALDLLQLEVPRAFVNLVTTLNVSMIADFNAASGLICQGLHLLECKCASRPKSSAAYAKLVGQVEEYTQALIDLVNSGRYDKNHDFTVVVQPFFHKTEMPMITPGNPDFSYLAPDCFHFSGKGHAAAALALWNSMVEPVGKKRHEWVLGEALECPTPEHPYLFTSVNSRSL